MKGKWLIWSNEHKAWWAPNSLGYTAHQKDAGRYSYKEACEICRGANLGTRTQPMETMVREQDCGGRLK